MAAVSIASNMVVDPNSSQTGDTARISAAAPPRAGLSGHSRKASSPVIATQAVAKAGPTSRAAKASTPTTAQTRLISQNSSGGLCP